MVRRFAASLVVAALLVTLFLPASVAAGEEAGDDGTAVVPADADALALDRLRSNGAAPNHARDDERADGRSVASRVEREDAEGVLEQSTRAAVYRAIRESPGGTLNGIADAVDVTTSTIRYHAHVLREAGLVDATEVAGALRFAPADADVELQAVLRADGAGAVLDAVATHERPP